MATLYLSIVPAICCLLAFLRYRKGTAEVELVFAWAWATGTQILFGFYSIQVDGLVEQINKLVENLK